MPFKIKILLLFLLHGAFVSAQSQLETQELELNTTLLSFRNAVTREEMDTENQNFKKQMHEFLQKEGAFNYTFKHLESVAILDSPDGKIRIVNWNIEYPDMSYAYSGFIMINENKSIRLIALNDMHDAYEEKPIGTVDFSDWYGALYYKIIPFENGNKTEYLLLGWDGGTTGSNFKILDVLVLGKRNVRFGSPVFISDNKLQKRIVFEYANEAVMNMRFEEKYGRIVMDHLSPEAPALEGIYSYYVPDLSYDSYAYNGSYWVLKEDVIAVNDPESEPKSFIQMNPRTGKLERKKLKKDWINPTNIKQNDGDINHVARTPELESESTDNSLEYDKKAQRKLKRVYRKDPSGLSITTGKYKRKKNRNKMP